jgi:hypothetical protein
MRDKLDEKRNRINEKIQMIESVKKKIADEDIQKSRHDQFYALWGKRKSQGWRLGRYRYQIGHDQNVYEVYAPPDHPHCRDGRDGLWAVEHYDLKITPTTHLKVPHYYYGSIHTMGTEWD